MRLSLNLAAITVAAAAIACGTVRAEDAPARLGIWDLPLGTLAADLPDRFVDYACGTGGGPPSRPLPHFSGFALCRADAAGFYEVYFRYDDELDYLARAFEQPRLMGQYFGTKVYGYPVVTSALFDAAGVLSGIRIVTDPRGAAPEVRNDFWTLGTMLRARFGTAGWECADIPLQAGEEPVGSFLLKTNCTKAEAGFSYRIEQRHLRRRGQNYLDGATRLVVPSAFESLTLFEMFATEPVPTQR